MATPIITTIEIQIKTLIESMSVAGGYLLDWAPINFEDRALEDSGYNAFACLYWDGEENLDDPEGLHFQAYYNVDDYIIEVRCPLTSESSNPKFDIRQRLQLALSDLKKVFGTYSSLNGNVAAKTMYRGARILEKGSAKGDRFTPVYLEVRISVWYFQDRQDVYTTCM